MNDIAREPPLEAIDAPPHSIEAERSVLGALLIDNASVKKIRGLISAEDFYSGANREIFEHIEARLREGEPADVVLVSESLQGAGKLEYVGGLASVFALAEHVPTSANIRGYARLVRESADLRRVAAAALDVHRAAMRPSGIDANEIRVCLHEIVARAQADAEARSPSYPNALDFTALAQTAPPARVWRVDRNMAAGVVSLWTGHGGAGKTQGALHLAICVALGLPFFGRDVIRARVAFVATEDDADELHYRILQQARTIGVTLDDLAGHLFVYALGEDESLFTIGADRQVAATPLFAWLRAEFKAAGIEVAVLDNATTLFAIDLIRPGDVSKCIAKSKRLVAPGGNVVVLAHVDKATAKAGYSTEAYSGTAAWHNRPRCRWYMYAPNTGEDADEGDDTAADNGERLLEVQKNNAGRVGDRFALRISQDSGAVVLAAPVDGIVASIQRGNERKAVLAAVAEAAERGINVPAAETNRATAYEALEAMPSYPEALRGRRGKARLFYLLRQMRADREIEGCEFQGSGRHRREGYRLPGVES